MEVMKLVNSENWHRYDTLNIIDLGLEKQMKILEVMKLANSENWHRYDTLNIIDLGLEKIDENFVDFNVVSCRLGSVQCYQRLLPIRRIDKEIGL